MYVNNKYCTVQKKWMTFLENVLPLNYVCIFENMFIAFMKYVKCVAMEKNIKYQERIRTNGKFTNKKCQDDRIEMDTSIREI